MLVLGGFLASCTHDDLDYSSIVENKKAAYQEVFVDTYGKIDPNQTWGFGSESAATARGLTRGDVDTWSLSNHNDGWMDFLDFEVPTGAIKVASSDQTLTNGTYHITKDFTGTLNFADNFVGDVYVDAKITQFSGNLTTLNLYILKDGSWECASTTGNITVYNLGNLILPSWGLKNQNIKNIYNGGYFQLGSEEENVNPDIADGTGLYSNSSATINIIGKKEKDYDWETGTDLKFTCDVHSYMYVTGDLKIQNSRTQYICGLIVSGHLEMTQGNLQTSYVKANDIKFDGSSIWLLPQGYIVANKISMVNSATYIYGYTDSRGLVETTDWYFRNHNNFTSAFSDNIYFKIDGSIDIEERVDRDNGNGGTQTNNETNTYDTAADYIASQNGKELADRINSGISVTPDCGGSYGNSGGDDITIPTDKGETSGNVITVETTTEYYETTELIEQGRVFCEDLGQISSNDLDFNDAVFDAYVYKIIQSTHTTVTENDIMVKEETVKVDSTYKTSIVLLAAGGTLELTVAGKEVHNELGGNPTSTIINTITSEDEAYYNTYVANNPVVLGKDFGYSSIADIPIRVRYGNGSVLELTAETGWAPHKILVPIGTPWCKERVNIADAYLDFKNYVGSSQNFWEGQTNGDKLYFNLTYASSDAQRTTGSVLINKTTETSSRTEGSSTSGGYQNDEPVLSRELR